MSEHGKHENYEILNLIGYALAKFNHSFIEAFGFRTKAQFYDFLVSNNIAKTSGVIKNRQDLFDPFFDNGRKGWWQKGDAYIHRKISIDLLFGSLNVIEFVNITKLYLQDNYPNFEKSVSDNRPIIKSKFKQLQETGQKAEVFFMTNYKKIKCFENGVLEDARFFGDGYDFQIEVENHFFLTEIKGIRANSGSIRMTKNEFNKAQKYNNDYAVVVISNLDDIPSMNVVFNPVEHINFTKTIINSKQFNYHSDSLKWKDLY